MFIQFSIFRGISGLLVCWSRDLRKCIMAKNGVVTSFLKCLFGLRLSGLLVVALKMKFTF